MNALVIKLTKRREDIEAEVSIGDATAPDGMRSLGLLYGLTLQDVEWLIQANSSEHTTPFMVGVS